MFWSGDCSMGFHKNPEANCCPFKTFRGASYYLPGQHFNHNDSKEKVEADYNLVKKFFEHCGFLINKAKQFRSNEH